MNRIFINKHITTFSILLFIGVFLGFNTSFAAMIEKAKALGIIKEKFLPDQEYEEEEEGR